MDGDRLEESARKPELLEIGGDSEDDKRRRLRQLIEKLNANPKPAPVAKAPAFDFGDRTTFSVGPSALLSRVQSFLPQLEASNTLLAEKMQTDPQSINIEHIEPQAEQYIKMDLGLGVYEQKKPSHDLSMDSSSSSSSSSESEDEEDSDADTDSSAEIITSFIPSARRIKPLPRRTSQRPEIVVLNES